MKSLIKWPGGKEREFVKFQDLIPGFTRYIEPFFGGGAVFFSLDTRGKETLVNDLSTDLMVFYQLVQKANPSFKENLYGLVNIWEDIDLWLDPLLEDIVELYRTHCTDANVLNQLDLNLSTLLVPNNFPQEITLNSSIFQAFVQENLLEKLKRMRQLEIKKGEPLSLLDIKDNIYSGVRSGFYMHFRAIYNDIILGRNQQDKFSLGYQAAVFYFIREYCYGSMFRYNLKGEFNIPYGGISYSKKNFRKKVDRLFAPEVYEKLQKVHFHNEDFEAFLVSLKITSEDFIFLDPPYDSDFSDYEKRSFGQEDQVRLANFLLTTKGKFMLVIKNTPFIHGLYSGKESVNIHIFDKVYTYNVRGRNQRDVKHLIITNY